MPRKPLAGKTIVVTRPRKQAGAFAAALKAAGARVLLAPMIRIAPPLSYARLDASLKTLSRFDAVVFTSRNAVDAFFARAKSLRLRIEKPPPRVSAIGTATAAAVRANGWPVHAIPDRFQGEDLAGAIGKVRGARILIPRAKAAREVLPQMLRFHGAKVSTVEAYRTLPDKTGAAKMKKVLKGGADAVTFTSGSTVQQFCAQVGLRNARRLFKTTIAASIGPVTSFVLIKNGIKPVVQAEKATSRSLLQGLKEHFNG